jgi:hypothetical protein
MMHQKRLVELISSLEKLLSRVKLLRLNSGLAINRPTFHLDTSGENSRRFKGDCRTSLDILQGPEKHKFPVETVYPLFGDTLMGFSGAEETLQSLEQIPDAQWPSMDWNLDLLSINPEFFTLFDGIEVNAGVL